MLLMYPCFRLRPQGFGRLGRSLLGLGLPGIASPFGRRGKEKDSPLHAEEGMG